MHGQPIGRRWNGADPTPTREAQPGVAERVNPGMRLKTLQIAAGLGAAIAFLLAFMAAGAMVASLLFAVIGASLVAWIAYGVAKSLLDRRVSHARHPAVRPPTA